MRNPNLLPPFRLGELIAQRYTVRAAPIERERSWIARAFDRESGDEVCLETPMGGEPAEAAGYTQAFRLALHVSHPNVVRALAVIEHEGRPVLVTTPIEGEALAAHLDKNGTLAADDALRVAVDIARALTAAHAAGVAHGRLRAEHVTLVTSDDATAEGGQVRAVVEGFAVDGPLAQREDVRALGRLLELMIGGPSRAPAAALVAIASMTARDPRDRPPARGAQALLERALRVRPAGSFGSAAPPPAFEMSPGPALTAEPERGKTQQLRLHLHADARWFRVGSGPEVDIGKRHKLRNVLLTLVRHYLSKPDTAVSVERLFSLAWGDERVLRYAAASRVYVAVSTLRRMGLRDVLVSVGDGYQVAPGVEVEFHASPQKAAPSLES